MRRIRAFGASLFIFLARISADTPSATPPVATAQDDTAPVATDPYEAALDLFRTSDFEAAEKAFGEVLKREPERAASLYYRALARDHLGRTAEAIEDLDMMISVKPQDFGAFLTRARLRLDVGNFRGALNDATIAIRLDTKHDGGWNMRGLARVALEQYDLALKDFERGLAIYPDREALYGRAEAHLWLGHAEKARELYAALQAGTPDDPRATKGLGTAQVQLLQFTDAVTTLKVAEEGDPKDSDTAFYLGVAHYGRGAFADAARELQRANALGGTSVYGTLLGFLAQKRAGLPITDIKPTLAKIPLPWPVAVGQFLLGEKTDVDLFKLAEGTADEKERNGHLCEAAFYVGTLRLVAGDKFAARTLFKQAAATPNTTFVEHVLARAELQKL
jgi:tetratricopeptide (TPR) repeat protein